MEIQEISSYKLFVGKNKNRRKKESVKQINAPKVQPSQDDEGTKVKSPPKKKAKIAAKSPKKAKIAAKSPKKGKIADNTPVKSPKKGKIADNTPAKSPAVKTAKKKKVHPLRRNRHKKAAKAENDKKAAKAENDKKAAKAGSQEKEPKPLADETSEKVPKPSKKNNKKKKAKKVIEKSDSGVDSTEEPKAKNKKAQNADETSKGKNAKKRKNEDQKISTPAKKKSKIEEQENEEDFRTEMKSWSDLFLPDSCLKGIFNCGFTEPTEIQRLVLPPAIKGRLDIVGAAPTGSGKTLAFGLPVIEGILRLLETETDTNNDEEEESMEIDEELKEVKKGRKLYSLILTPTRELAMQIKTHLENILKEFPEEQKISITAIIGGMAIEKQERLLKRGSHIIVATPGRLYDLIQRGNEYLEKLNQIRFLVVDEADRMVESGHFEEMKSIMEILNGDEDLYEKRQNFVFSATLMLTHSAPKRKKLKSNKKMKVMSAEEKLAGLMKDIKIRKARKIIDLSRNRAPQPLVKQNKKVNSLPDTLTEFKIHCSHEEKDYYLYYFFQIHRGRTLIFANSIECVRRLVNLFTLLQCKPLSLHAKMEQKQRLSNLERFTSNPESVLVATDVAARGLDICDVDYVIHYQVPRTSETYIHRSGRTARAMKKGSCLILCDPKEIQTLKALCNTIQKDATEFETFPVEAPNLRQAKMVVSLAREIDIVRHRNKKEDLETNWRKKNAKEADLIISDSESDNDSGFNGGDSLYKDIEGDGGMSSHRRKKSKHNKYMAAKKAELNLLLMKPFTAGQSFAMPKRV